MPNFRCPVCNFKTFSEKDEKEHAKTHQKTALPTKPAAQSTSTQPAEPATKKPDEPKKPFIMPDFIKRFLHKNVLITMIDGSTISGQLTGFNNYDLMLDEKILILKHAMMKMQEVETNP
jgi:sRNA-binding regulator protein Hfq